MYNSTPNLNNEHTQFDVAIIGIPNNGNYGATLTLYALYKTVELLGYKTLIVNQTRKFPHNTSIGVNFFAKYTKISKFCRTNKDFAEINDMSNTFILGSDQLWNPNVVNTLWNPTILRTFFYYLDFVNSSKKKIAYSTSLGSNGYNDNEFNVYIKHFLNQFDNISIRETNGVSILKDKFGIDDVVCNEDPVFLLDVKYYNDLVQQSKVRINKGYILAYVFGFSKEYIVCLSNIAKHLNKPIVILMLYVPNSISLGIYQSESVTLINATSEEILPEDWLAYIKNSDFVITNSFHGTCFSIIFKKEFVCTAKHTPQRFISLLEKYGILDRLLETPEQILDYMKNCKKLDYVVINQQMEVHVNRSKKWLENAIASPKVERSLDCVDITNLLNLLVNKVHILESQTSKLKIQANPTNTNLEKLLPQAFGIFYTKNSIILFFFFIRIVLKMTDSNINKIAWWIPVKKWRNNFSAKFQ